MCPNQRSCILSCESARNGAWRPALGVSNVKLPQGDRERGNPGKQTGSEKAKMMYKERDAAFGLKTKSKEEFGLGGDI